MTDKLDNLEYAIVSLLQENQPKMLRWIEVVKCLWPEYKFRYKTEKGFGVAVTNKLKLLVGSGKVKHEGIHYGTPSSTIDKSSSKAEAKNIIKIVEELRRELRFFREPNAIEVALKVGRDPETVNGLLYLTAPSTGWKAQSQGQAEREAEDAINLAGWFCWKEKGEQNPELEELSKEAINNASAGPLRRAQDILKNYPDLVPKIRKVECYLPEGTTPRWPFIFGSELPVLLDELTWPEKTKAIWRYIFGSEPPPAHQYLGAKAMFFNK